MIGKKAKKFLFSPLKGENPIPISQGTSREHTCFGLTHN